MAPEINRSENSFHPPRWADALLRSVLTPEDAEVTSGDLIEVYRDSIRPFRGRWQADLWFVRQVAGYILRIRTTSLGNWILAGLMLCVFTTKVFAVTHPEFITCDGIGLGWVVMTVYACAAVFGTRPRNERHALVLLLGQRWGIAIGIWWIVFSLCAHLLIPHARLGVVLFFAFLLPFASGAHGALRTGRLRDGIQICFWIGLISGVMTFLGLFAINYVLNVPDVLDDSGGFLFSITGALNLFCGTIGSCVGRMLLERTGSEPAEPPVW